MSLLRLLVQYLYRSIVIGHHSDFSKAVYAIVRFWKDVSLRGWSASNRHNIREAVYRPQFWNGGLCSHISLRILRSVSGPKFNGNQMMMNVPALLEIGVP